MKIKTAPLLFCLLLSCGLSAQHDFDKKYISFKTGTDKLLLPKNKLRFAKKIVAAQSAGSSDYSYQVNNKVLQSTSNTSGKSIDYILLEEGEHLILKFRRKSIKDVTGIDMFVFADSLYGKCSIMVSNDLKDWKKAGMISSHKHHLDIANKIPVKSRYKYLRITAEGKGSRIKLKQIATANPGNSALGIEEKIKNDTILTNSTGVRLQIRDFRSFDWDFISVSINGQVISKNKLLTKMNRFVNLPLRMGANTIKVRARNEGLIRPNTIDMKIVDGIIINIGTFRIRKGRTKTIIIIRKE